MTSIDKTEFLLALAILLPALYLSLYLLFRARGVLRVNAAGWQAGGVWTGRRLWLPAMWVFGFFQPLLRLESLLARRLDRDREHAAKRDQGVSEVVVELIPMA